MNFPSFRYLYSSPKNHAMKKISTLMLALCSVIFVNAQLLYEPSSSINFANLSTPFHPNFTSPSRWHGMQTQLSNTISDTIDILHFTVKLDITDMVTDTIRGGTVLKFTPRMNGVTSLPLDLLHMHIDSIADGNNLLAYTYDDTLLTI